MNNIGKHIRTIRTRKKMTQEALAEILHVTRQTVSNYETGKSQPDIDTLLNIAQALDTDVNCLIYGLPDPNGHRQAFVQALAAGGLILILLIPYLLLCNWSRNDQLFQGMFLHTLYLVFRPILYTTFGWLLTHATLLVCKAKPITFRGHSVVKGVLWALLGVLFLVPLPFVIWLCFICYNHLARISGSSYFPHIPVYGDILMGIDRIVTYHPFVISILAGICRLVGMPFRSKPSIPSESEYS